MSQTKKTEMVDKGRSDIVLCLEDKVLRDVAKEPTAASDDSPSFHVFKVFLIKFLVNYYLFNI